MIKVILGTFIFSTMLFAENSRMPAVLDGTCNLNIATTESKIVDGKKIIVDRLIADVLKEQCAQVKKCMYSAAEEEMDSLKSLEAVACNNNLNAITTKAPGSKVEKDYDGKRKAKFEKGSEDSPINVKPSADVPK